MKHKDWDLPEIPASLPPKPKPKKKPADNSLEGVFGPDTHLYEDLQRIREEDWRKTVLAFEANQSVHNAYWYVASHPMFYYFTEGWNDGRAPRVHERHLEHDQGWEGIRVTPHLVNPASRRISDDPSQNTKTEFWYEFGPTLFRENGGRGIRGHDHECDGGADTYDEAIIKIAKEIHKTYGNDRRKVVTKWKDPELPLEMGE